MKVLHITPATDGYEVVTLLANKYSRKNSFTVIEKNGNKLITGGIILNDTEDIRNILDSLPNDMHYKIAMAFKSEPFVKEYYID